MKQLVILIARRGGNVQPRLQVAGKAQTVTT